mmetsp:Transcript_67426/g.161746  ORF Transcript_67426/g.161746 Transcript_67426/m.161746 type:complete len:450 (+) Transcript_67426:50-1399(+)
MLRRSSARLVALPPCDFTPPKYSGPSADELLARRHRCLNPVHFHFYSKPIAIVQGHRQYLWDDQGRRYLDLFGGVTTISVGHSHPRINAVIEDQSKRFNHTTSLYLTEPILEFCETFAAKLPAGHEWVVQPVNSGSEANDFAMLMARVHTKSHPIVGLRYGYHGFAENSRGMISVPGWRHNIPAPAGLMRTACPHPYHGIFGDDVDAYVKELETMIACETGGQIAAFMAERIQGVGGAVELLPGYLKKAYDVVKAHGGLFVCDEVQCGYGRLGSHYWGFETEGIVPDIVTSAKSVANGYPVGVVACKREVAESMRGVLYFNTFGGGGVCSRVATETLRIIDDEELQKNCALVGPLLKSGLLALAEKHSIIGNVRGMGCMVGCELVKDRSTKEAAKEETARFMELLKDEGILVGKGGPGGNVVRLHPPMVITEADVKAFLTAADTCLAKL